jgi:hypothetical protein
MNANRLQRRARQLRIASSEDCSHGDMTWTQSTAAACAKERGVANTTSPPSSGKLQTSLTRTLTGITCTRKTEV